MAVRALSRTGRLRVVGVGTSPVELRFEPRASGTVVEGTLTSVCIGGVSYVITGLRASTIAGKWACGGSALVSGFRRSGQPIATWNTRLPVDTDITEAITVLSHDRFQWDYTGTSAVLGGAVHTTVILDATTGRLASGQRVDPKSNTRYAFSYTTIFAPIALP
jgi:hypothetical protein